MNKFRSNGAVGALLDEYDKAIDELILVIKNISDVQLALIMDNETKDSDCISIGSILNHVNCAGRNYLLEIRKSCGEHVLFNSNNTRVRTHDYIMDLEELKWMNNQLFEDYPNLILETNETHQKMKVRWGQTYDVEQLFEHAIVHILRHRRQIERFLLLIEK